MIWWILGIGAFIFLISGVQVATAAKELGTPLSPFAAAIGKAEGYYVVNSRPWRNNNPGDMILAPPASNYTSNSDGTYAIFDTSQDGWQALEDELDYIRRGVSKKYTVNMTFQQMAAVYSPQGANDWANNVAREVGAQPTESIASYL